MHAVAFSESPDLLTPLGGASRKRTVVEVTTGARRAMTGLLGGLSGQLSAERADEIREIVEASAMDRELRVLLDVLASKGTVHVRVL